MNRRILQEIKKARENSLFHFYEENSRYYLIWTPQSGYYQGQTHVLTISFTYGKNHTYPRDPPNVKFMSPIYHTNIGPQGSICVDILKQGSGPQSWSPLYGLEQIFNSIVLLLEEHNVDSPYNPDASKDYQNLTRKEFQNKAMEYYQKKMTPTLRNLIERATNY